MAARAASALAQHREGVPETNDLGEITSDEYVRTPVFKMTLQLMVSNSIRLIFDVFCNFGHLSFWHSGKVAVYAVVVADSNDAGTYRQSCRMLRSLIQHDRTHSNTRVSSYCVGCAEGCCASCRRRWDDTQCDRELKLLFNE